MENMIYKLEKQLYNLRQAGINQEKENVSLE
jgi:hypothetical protein